MKSADRKKFFFFSFAVPVCLLLLYFIWRGIAPFGEKTFLIHDMNSQYVDYFAYMRSVLSGKNDFSYIMSRELGGDFRSFFAYYLISPFNLIMVAAPESMIPAAVSVEMLLLFGLAGLSCYYCLSKYTDGEDRPLLLYLSTAYSVSAWMLLNAENFQFIPEAIILPLVLTGVRKFRKEGKILPLILWLTAAVAVNFYIGYMIFLFVLIWTVIPDGDRFDWRIFPIFLIAAVLSSPVWLPAAGKIGQTIKSADSAWYSPRINFNVMEFAGKFLPGNFDAEQYQDHGLPAVYCGLIALGCMVYYFGSGGFSKVKQHRLIILLILTASLFFRPMTMIWHGFSEPHWWPYRFSFLLIFIIVLSAAESRLRVPWLILLLGVCGLFYNLDRTFSVKITDCTASAAYVERVEAKRSVIDSIKTNDGEIFRVGDISPRSDNDAMHFSYLGITGFDSLADRSVMSFLKNIGFPQERYTVRYSLGNTAFANSLLGVRYRIFDNEAQKSDLPAGVAFITENTVFGDLSEKDDAVELQNSLAADLGLSDPFLKVITEDEKSYENLECSEEFCWTLSAKDPGSIFYKFSSEDDGILYAHFRTLPVVGEFSLKSGDAAVNIRNQDYFLPIGEIGPGKTVTAEVKIKTPLSDIPEIDFILEDTAAVNRLFEGLFNGIETERITSSMMRIGISSADKAQTLVVTVPYDKKWKAFSGTSELKTFPVWGLFLGVEIGSMTSEVMLQYK